MLDPVVALLAIAVPWIHGVIGDESNCFDFIPNLCRDISICGIRRVGNALCPKACGRCAVPTTLSPQPITTSPQPTTTSAQRSTTSLQPTTTSLQPTTTSLQPTTTSLQPTTTSFQPTTTSAQPSTTSLQPTTTSSQPTTASLQPTTTSPSKTTPSPQNPGGSCASYIPDSRTSCKIWAENGFCTNDFFTFAQRRRVCATTCRIC